MAYANKGWVNKGTQYQHVLLRNLIYLGAIADADSLQRWWNTPCILKCRCHGVWNHISLSFKFAPMFSKHRHSFTVSFPNMLQQIARYPLPWEKFCFVSQFGHQIVYAEEIEAMAEVIPTKPKFNDSNSQCCENCFCYSMFLNENMLFSGDFQVQMLSWGI